MANNKDCFAYISDNECFALEVKKCTGCSFYKPDNCPELAQIKILRDVSRQRTNYYRTPRRKKRDSGDEKS